MFSNCSNVKTLNLSNFNTNKVKDFDNIFFGLNKKCEVITSDEKLIEELKNL
jgi:surface protein